MEEPVKSAVEGPVLVATHLEENEVPHPTLPSQGEVIHAPDLEGAALRHMTDPTLTLTLQSRDHELKPIFGACHQ